MKNYLKISILMLLSIGVFAQNKQNSFKQSFSGADKRVVILSASSNLTIEGVAGTEVIVESDKQEKEFPDEAQGLKIVSPGGATDNTGIGANVQVEGNTLKIRLPKSKYYGNFVVKVPKDLSVSIKENGNSYGKWFISGMKGEVEAETSYSTLNIKNVSGPIVARGGYGKIYVEYDQLSQSRPNSISASGAVDITLPADAKANLKVQATYADFFTDFDITPATLEDKEKKGEKGTKINAAFPNGQQAKAISINGNVNSTTMAEDLAKLKEKVVNLYEIAASSDCNCGDTNATIGTINGGGVNLIIKSDHGNVYLRKKK
jgi:Putative adhesin